MTETTQPRKTKERSPSYPFIPLTEAIERAQKFHREERRGTAPMQRAALHWGYSANSSGVLQTISAMKQYGLLEDEGSGKERKLKLTDLAFRILLDTREESSEREQYKRTAARNPPIAAEVHEKWPDKLPADATLNHFLVLERGFNQATAIKVVRILKENEGLTRISDDDSISEHMRTDNELDGSSAISAPRPASVRVTDSLLERQIGDRRARSFGSLAAAPNCTIHLLADGIVTQGSLDKLKAYIDLIKDSFPEKEESAR